MVGVQNTFLQCELEEVRVKPEVGVVEFWIRQGQCVDMKGAIQLAMVYQPDVVKVITYSGLELDTRYVRYSEPGPCGWVAIDPEDRIWGSPVSVRKPMVEPGDHPVLNPVELRGAKK